MRVLAILLSFLPTLLGDGLVVKRVENVYDGVTIYRDLKDTHSLFGDDLGIKIRGIDAPEIRTKNLEEKKVGYQTKSFRERRIAAAFNIELINLSRGKFFRVVGDVMLDGMSAGKLMILAGFTKTYFVGKKMPWSE